MPHLLLAHGLPGRSQPTNHPPPRRIWLLLTVSQEEAGPLPTRQPQLMACTGQAHCLELQGRDGPGCRCRAGRQAGKAGKAGRAGTWQAGRQARGRQASRQTGRRMAGRQGRQAGKAGRQVQAGRQAGKAGRRMAGQGMLSS